MKTNQKLSLAAAVLLVLSGWTYYQSVTRAERFERGQKFLQQLNPDEIATIRVTKGEEEVHLRRQGEELVVASADGYPAANESVNRFIRDVLDIGLTKEVGTGEDLESELGLAEGSEDAIEVAFVNESGKDMVRFRVGSEATAEGVSGQYVKRLDGDDPTIYLTESRIFLRTSEDDFLKKEILDVLGEEIVSLSGPSWEIRNEDDTWKLADLPSGKKESSKVSQARYALSGLRFTKHYLADAPEVAVLNFDTEVKVGLRDDSGYLVSLAEMSGKHYLKIEGYHNAQQVSIAVDAGDEEVQETADVLERLTEIDDFNRFHGSWVYEVSESTAKKFRLERSELFEDA